jgi:hypothetical protein
MPGRRTALEDLDDDHVTATAWTKGLTGIGGGGAGQGFRFCNGKQLTGASDVVGASAFGEQAVVANAMQAFGCACRKLNPGIFVMESAQGWATKNVPGAIDGARDRCIFLQG